MSAALLRLIATTVASSLAAAARPATTFFAMQLTVFVLVHREVATIPTVFELVISIPAIFVVALLAILETLAKHDPDIAVILRETHIDEITGACGALGAALLFTALGMPETEVATLVEEGAAGEVLGTTAETAATEYGVFVQAGVVGGALAINIAMSYLRRHLLRHLYDYKLDKFWAFLESGGVIALLVLLPFVPLLVFAAPSTSWISAADNHAKTVATPCEWRHPFAPTAAPNAHPRRLLPRGFAPLFRRSKNRGRRIPNRRRPTPVSDQHDNQRGWTTPGCLPDFLL